MLGIADYLLNPSGLGALHIFKFLLCRWPWCTAHYYTAVHAAFPWV